MAAKAAFLQLSSTFLVGLPYNRNLYSDVCFAECCKGTFLINRKPAEAVRCQTEKKEDDALNDSGGKKNTLLERLNLKYGKEEEDVTGLSHSVDCHVDVISWRERRITASIVIDANLQTIWQVLTDYERLSEFIPNLVHSEIIPCPYPGRLWLLQKGMQRMMYWNIEAHVILDLKEFPLTGELHFFMIDGDFMRYDGKWSLQVGPRSDSSVLYYEVNVVPKIIFPAAFVESIIKADLPRNLCAIAKRAEAKVDCKLPDIASTDTLLQADQASSKGDGIRNDNLGKAGLQWNGIGQACKLGSQCLVDEIHFRRLDDLLENGGVHRQVVASVTVKASCKDVWSVLTAYEALPEFVPNLANSIVLSREGNNVRLMQEGCKCLLYMVLHARVILDLLEQPEQKISFKQIEGDFDAFQGTWTLRQLGGQHTVLKYAVDTKICKNCILAESLVEEVIYEDLPSNLCAICNRVESLVNSSSSCLVGISDTANSSELAVSSVGFKFNLIDAEDVDNQSTVQVDAADVDNQSSTHNDQDESSFRDLPTCPSPKSTKRCHRHIKGLRNDFGMLKREIRDFLAKYGTEGMMPTRKHLRMYGRFDLDKAITIAGGYRSVAARMKLSLSYNRRKPAGYWDNIQNLRSEVIAAQKELGCDPAVLPSRLSVQRLGNFGLARTYEKWGGAKEMARILGLVPKRSKLAHPHHKPQLLKDTEFPWDIKPYNTDMLQVVGTDTETAPKIKPYHTGVPQESAKWLTLVADMEENAIVKRDLDDVKLDW